MSAPAPLTDAEVVALGEGRAIVRDGVLGPLADALRDAAEALRDEDGLTPAGLGRGGALREDVRGDLTAWVAEQESTAPWDALWRWFDALREEVNRAAWLGLRRFSVQIACYPGDGSHYARHRDAFSQDPSRRLTAIVYLNRGWRPEHGGRLRIWEPGGERVVAPRFDRLVLFLSQELEHEVEPAWAARYAVTAWYRGDDNLPVLDDPSVALG